MKAFARVKEHSWLSQVSHWSNVVGLTGLKGAGKSSLIRHWSFLNNKKIKIIQFNRFGHFSETLGRGNEPPEVALESLVEQITDIDVVIWEDVHHLAPKVQATLIPFLKSQFATTLHVLISDESMEDFKVDIPISNVNPLQRDEIPSYVTEFLGISDAFDLDFLQAKTGGFPVYLNMWSQSLKTGLQDGKGSGLNLLASLSEKELEALQIVSIFPQGYPQQNSSLIDSSIIGDLEKKLYIVMQGPNCVVQPCLIDLVRSAISTPILERYSKMAALELKKIGSKDSLSIFSLALQSKSKELITDIVMIIEPKSFEGLPTNELKIFETLFNDLDLFGSSEVFGNEFARLSRIHLHIRVLAGNRNSALEMGSNLIKRLPAQQLWETEILLLIYDIIHWHHRSGNFQEVEPVLGIASNLAAGEMKMLFRLEQAFCFVEKEPQRALQTLDQIIQSVEAFPKVAAQVWFQKGRSHFFMNDFDKAALAYQHAGRLYKSLDQIYFFLIAQMNLLWTYLELKNLAAYEAVQQTILDLSQKYGYKYIRAGCLLAAAQVDRTEMQFGRALEKTMEAEKLFPQNAPPKARQDLIFEKILVLSHLGLLEEAEKHVLLFENKDLQLKARLFGNLIESNLEEILDLWKFEKNDHYQVLTLQAGGTLAESEMISLKLSKSGRWFILESSLVKSLKNGDLDQVWTLIGQLENLISNIGEMSCERIALGLLQAQLSQGPDRVKWLSRVEIELKRWGCDERFKNPFRAWLTSVSSGAKITDLPEWKQSRLNDQERWSRWIQSTAEKSTATHIIRTMEHTTDAHKLEATDVSEIKKRYKVVLIEELGQVFFKAKEIKEFHRKSVIRQILALILESYPASVSKSQMSLTVWGESYSSDIHDSRIYTSVQRLRDLIGDGSIIAWDGGYKWNPTVTFAFVESNGLGNGSQHKVQTLIVQALQNFKKSGRLWASRSELLEVTGASESTLKREISKLMSQEIILRKGSGPATVYSVR